MCNWCSSVSCGYPACKRSPISESVNAPSPAQTQINPHKCSPSRGTQWVGTKKYLKQSTKHLPKTASPTCRPAHGHTCRCEEGEGQGHRPITSAGRRSRAAAPLGGANDLWRPPRNEVRRELRGRGWEGGGYTTWTRHLPATQHSTPADGPLLCNNVIPSHPPIVPGKRHRYRFVLVSLPCGNSPLGGAHFALRSN